MPKQPIPIETADGICPATLFRPERDPGALRGAIFYMDGVGIRPALDQMAGRLAALGYVVLLPDLFYRFGAYGPFEGAALGDPTVRGAMMEMIRGTSQEMTRRDSAAFLDTLAGAGVAGPVAAVGYCMGGGRALTAAGSYPDRVAAAASFHGGNLASEAEDSPHRLAGSIRARVYVGTAGVDSSFPPEQSARLAEALRSGGVDHIIENYVGAAHGWAVPDLPVFNHTAAERHWIRLESLFGETLG